MIAVKKYRKERYVRIHMKSAKNVSLLVAFYYTQK